MSFLYVRAHDLRGFAFPFETLTAGFFLAIFLFRVLFPVFWFRFDFVSECTKLSSRRVGEDRLLAPGGTDELFIVVIGDMQV